MPMVPGAVCAGSIIATRGLDAAVRGLKKGRLRPSLAIIDDPDTENSAEARTRPTSSFSGSSGPLPGLPPKAGECRG